MHCFLQLFPAVFKQAGSGKLLPLTDMHKPDHSVGDDFFLIRRDNNARYAFVAISGIAATYIMTLGIDGYAFGQIPWLVDITAFDHGDMICKELQWYNGDKRNERGMCRRHHDHVVRLVAEGSW